MDSPKQLVKQTSFDVIRDSGNNILDSNEFFKDLSDIMEDEKFNSFFKKYFYNSTESKITLIYMTLYDEFKSKWKELNDTELDKRINVFLLWRIMKDRHTNKFAINTVLKKMDNPNNTDIFNRGFRLKKIELDASYPDYILENKKNFSKWIV